MKIANSITELTGNTPLVRLNKIGKDSGADLVAKLEFFNPLSSIKDRIGVAILEDGKKRGLLRKDSVVIESTSGNTGIALAFVCAAKGYKLILTMPENMSEERLKLLEILGAEVVLTPEKEGMSGAVKKAEELKAKTPNSFMPRQFNNFINPGTHQKTTAKEIWRDTEGKVDIIVCGVGTGGTITGIAGALKSEKNNLKIVAVEPEKSSVLSGGEPGYHRIQGIGAGFIPEILDLKLIDEVVKVSDENAYEMTRRMAKEEGIFAGISSGAVAWAALEIAKREDSKGKLIVSIFADTGERYLSVL